MRLKGEFFWGVLAVSCLMSLATGYADVMECTDAWICAATLVPGCTYWLGPQLAGLLCRAKRQIGAWYLQVVAELRDAEVG